MEGSLSDDPASLETYHRWLLFYYHCSECRHGGQGPLDACKYGALCCSGKSAFSHVAGCNSGGSSGGESCGYPRCGLIKNILGHHLSCTDTECRVCAPVRSYHRARSQRASSLEPQQPQPQLQPPPLQPQQHPQEQQQQQSASFLPHPSLQSSLPPPPQQYMAHVHDLQQQALTCQRQPSLGSPLFEARHRQKLATAAELGRSSLTSITSTTSATATATGSPNSSPHNSVFGTPNNGGGGSPNNSPTDTGEALAELQTLQLLDSGRLPSLPPPPPPQQQLQLQPLPQQQPQPQPSLACALHFPASQLQPQQQQQQPTQPQPLRPPPAAQPAVYFSPFQAQQSTSATLLATSVADAGGMRQPLQAAAAPLSSASAAAGFPFTIMQPHPVQAPPYHHLHHPSQSQMLQMQHYWLAVQQQQQQQQRLQSNTMPVNATTAYHQSHAAGPPAPTLSHTQLPYSFFPQQQQQQLQQQQQVAAPRQLQPGMQLHPAAARPLMLAASSGFPQAPAAAAYGPAASPFQLPAAQQMAAQAGQPSLHVQQQLHHHQQQQQGLPFAAAPAAPVPLPQQLPLYPYRQHMQQ